MKKILLTICAFAILQINAQEQPNNGFLPSRVSTAARDLFVNPAKGLIIFNTTTNGLQINIGTGLVPNWDVMATTAQVNTAVNNAVGNNFVAGKQAISVSKIVAGDAFNTMFINSGDNNFIYGMGYGDNRIGMTTNTATTPQMILARAAVDIDTNFYNGIAAMADGSLYVWGNNDSGKNGDGTTTTINVPVQINLPGGVLAKK